MYATCRESAADFIARSAVVTGDRDASPTTKQPVTQLRAASQMRLAHAVRRLTARVDDLDARLEADTSAWGAYCDAVRTLAALLPALAEPGGELLTSSAMAQRLGVSVKTLLKHKKAGAIRPAVQRGKLIRWKGTEGLR
jgi:hypothetical protein